MRRVAGDVPEFASARRDEAQLLVLIDIRIETIYIDVVCEATHERQTRKSRVVR
jgi:hypothetical protein